MKKINELFEKQKNTHVLYAYTGTKNYIKQIVNFIMDGVKSEEYTIVIENERMYSIIHKELMNRLTEEQMKFVQPINNFDFYYSSGSYHPPAIQKYFNDMVQPYLDNNLSFRSWAHVEWTTMEDPLHLIRDFERIVDEAVNQLSFPLICAYKRENMPEYLKTILLETHPYVLLEDDYILSEHYQPLTEPR